MSKKQKNGGNRTAGIIKILIYAVLVLFCIFVFLLYGKKQRSIEAAASPNPSAAAVQTETVNVTPSPIPKLSPQELVSGLQSAGLDCVITQRSTLTDGSLECSLMLNRISGDGRLVVKPDSTEELPNAFLNSTIFMPKFSMTPKLMPLQELLRSSMNCAKNTTQS